MTATTKATTPVVIVRPIAGGNAWTLEIECPFCGRHHYHGGGPLTGDWREYLGHRISHCGRGGYELVATDSEAA